MNRLRADLRASGDGDAEVLDLEADAPVPDLEAREHLGEKPGRVEALGRPLAVAHRGVPDEVAQAERPREEILLRDVRHDRLAHVRPVPDGKLLAADRHRGELLTD